MIYATEEDEYGYRKVYKPEKNLLVGEFVLENGVQLFCPNPRIPFTQELLEAVLNMQKVLQP